MLFNSFTFLIFFTLVVLIFYSIPHKFRWIILLSASFYFYMYFIPIYVLILIFLILLDYSCAIWIEKTKLPKLVLTFSLVGNLLILVFFKYWNFLNSNLISISHALGSDVSLPFLEIALPVGLSFHTFQSMSYTIDVYNGKIKAEKHLGYYSLFVMFFPQLVAGPIERASSLLNQLKNKIVRLEYSNFIHGSSLIIRGLFKKIVVADQLGIFVDSVFDNYQVNNGFTLLLTAWFFAIQIYCDFSGYSDIAIGSAKILGYDMSLNFNLPFFSQSITEFWRKWHITLTTWFNEYLFTPLALKFRDLGKFGIAITILITFSLSGLWHGASWTFVIFGVLNGIALMYELVTVKFRKKITRHVPAILKQPLCSFAVFSFFAFTLIFFRAKSFEQSLAFFQAMGQNFLTLNIKDSGVFANCFFALLILIATEFFIYRKHSILSFIQSNKLKPLYITNFLFLMLILLFSVNSGAQFIYFQF